MGAGFFLRPATTRSLPARPGIGYKSAGLLARPVSRRGYENHARPPPPLPRVPEPGGVPLAVDALGRALPAVAAAAVHLSGMPKAQSPRKCRTTSGQTRRRRVTR